MRFLASSWNSKFFNLIKSVHEFFISEIKFLKHQQQMLCEIFLAVFFALHHEGRVSDNFQCSIFFPINLRLIFYDANKNYELYQLYVLELNTYVTGDIGCL